MGFNTPNMEPYVTIPATATKKADKSLQLQIVATNMHLSPEFGMTYKEIEADGFYIDKKVEMLLK